MTTRTLLSSALVTVLVLGCSHVEEGSPAASVGVERTVKEVSISEGTPVSMADISIEGMSCEMMCGGSIKKALAKLPGIASTEIKFIEGDERDHAIVTYDETKVSDAQMVDAIHSLHGGQYKVLAVDITKQVKSSGGGEPSASRIKSGGKEVTAYEPSSSTLLPSLIGLLTQIMRL